MKQATNPSHNLYDGEVVVKSCQEEFFRVQKTLSVWTAPHRMAFAIPAMAATTTKYGHCPTDEFIYVRSAASQTGDLYHLHNGEPVTVTGVTSNGYSKISSPVNGWVMTSYLTTSPEWKTRYGSKTMNLESYAHMLAFQKDLNKISGISIYEDGYWGDETKNAVKTFQTKVGITSDGIAGPQTKYRLYNMTH